jgi:hypothetical protein
MQSIESLCKVSVIGGEVKLPKVEYLKSEHQEYTINGRKVKGASTIAKKGDDGGSFLIKWANKLGLQGICSEAYMRHTANIGTIAHKMVELHLNDRCYEGIKVDVFDEYQSHESFCVYRHYSEIAFEKYLMWRIKNQSFTPIFTEKALVNYELGYGGTIDIYGELDGRKVLIDIKTSNSIYKSHRLQVGGGYYGLLLANYYPVDDVYILRIGRDENDPYQFNKVRNVDKLFSEFKKLI